MNCGKRNATYNEPISLIEQVAEIINRYNMAPGDRRIGVAVSGGADSVVLLHILHALALDLLVLHVNHRLRGSESDADEAFVRDLAGSLSLPIVVEHAPPPTGNLEQEAREIRRDFFRRAMEAGWEQERLARVALGHTRSDQAETVLLRLFRGSGLAGLAGMRLVTPDGFIRPLLKTGRAEVRAWAAANGLSWREDSSNADPRFSRNRLRNQILPALVEHFNPNLEAVLAATAGLAADEEEYWAAQVEPLFAQICRISHFGLILDVPMLIGLDVAVRRRVLRRALLGVRGDLRSLDIRHVEAILEVCTGNQAHGRVLVPGVDALRSYDKLRLAPPGSGPADRHYSVDLIPNEECELPLGAGTIYLESLERGASFCVNFKEDREVWTEVADLDADALPGQGTNYKVSIRNWTPGDAVLLPGHRTAEKIKSLFQENRILLWERRHWPVAWSGSEIVWVRRFGVAAGFQTGERTRRRLRLFYRAPE